MWNIVRQYKFSIFKAMQMYWGGIKNDLNNIDDVSAGTAVNIYECITLGQLAAPCKWSIHRQFILADF